MYRNKKDVDKHVDSLMFKLSPKDFQARAYSIARLYFEVGDYGSCQKYVEQYLTLKSNNAAAHKLLGQAFQKQGLKEKAIEQYKISLDIDPSQTSTILDVCQLLADDDITIEPGRAKYWCEKAEAMFPKHPVTFRLREKLLTVANPDPEALVKLLKSELETRPKDATLHIRLIKHLLQTNNIKEAFDHSSHVEFVKKLFSNNYAWYESLSKILKYNPLSANDWSYQLLLLTVKERICVLSLSEVPNSSKSLVESNDLLHNYDQAIDSVAKAGSSPGLREFHNSLLQHHRGQLAFHTATYLLKKAKKGQLSWREAKEFSAPLMLIAWHTIPLDSKVNWLSHAPEKQKNAVSRWYLEGSFRCSQSGYYLLGNMQNKSQMFLDQISQFCSGTHWKDKLYEKTFLSSEQLAKKKTSYLASDHFNAPSLRLPRKAEVQAYDDNAQREYPNSLHHFVWILLNYKNYAEFRCTLFDMLSLTTSTGCGPETLNKIDVLAFLFSATLTSQNLRDNKTNYISTEMPPLLPANITDLLCSLPQTKWWDCAYKLSQNELGVEYTDIRSTLSHGIEVLRCVDNHGLDPQLLCILGRIFIEKSKKSNTPEEKASLEARAQLYYSSAIPLLEKLKSKTVLKVPEKRMFDYTHKQLSVTDINDLLEESKLQIALSHLNDGEYENVINLLSNVKSPQAYFYLSETYKKIALEENNLTKKIDDKYGSLISKAKHYAYKALNMIQNSEEPKGKMYTDIQSLIEDLESQLNRIDIDMSSNVMNDIESSDEYVSVSEIGPMRSKPNHYQNVSSTPKQTRNNLNINATAYRTAVETTFESAPIDRLFLERLERQIKNMQKTETTIHDFMDQTKHWFEENRKSSNHIINTINSNIENINDQFRLLKISIDHVREQIDECRNESKDVADIKKQIAELKKEVKKLMKTTTDQAVDENDLYNLEDDYRTNENTAFGAQLPFTAPPVVPPFAQRLMPPFSMQSNPYQLYGQNLYNLYNQYSQFAQPPTVPGAPQIFDPTRTQMNYPGVYPTPDQMYLDVAHLVPPTLPTVPTIPPVATTYSVPIVTTVSSTSTAQPTTAVSTSKVSIDSKEISKSLPANVVITSSDPLPTRTTAPAPVLSVTIPQKHIKGSPHNYQIPLPSSTDIKTVATPVFSFPSSNQSAVTTTSNILNWNTKFLSSQAENTLSKLSGNNSFRNDSSENVVDGIFTGFSPNTSMNKSRTLSEKSNTSIENYDPCPDFKPIVPLPAEVKVSTGEEDETVIFSSRAKLFRFVDKQWKERGIGEIKLLKHKVTGKVRVLMRREQVHKICANHIISSSMEIQPMKNETKAYFWVAHDYAEETVILEKFCVRFKTADLGKEFYETFEKARIESKNDSKNLNIDKKAASEQSLQIISNTNPIVKDTADAQPQKTVIGGFTFSSKPTFKTTVEPTDSESKTAEASKNKINVFSGLTFNAGNSFTFGSLASTVNKEAVKTTDNADSTKLNTYADPTKLNISDVVEEFEPKVDFKPVVPLPALVDQKTGEEDEIVLFEHRAKLLRFDASEKEWKERGLGNIKLLVQKENNQKLRLLMRREQIMKVCCNHSVTKEMTFQKMPNMDKAVTWCAKDFSEGELVSETFCLRFKTSQLCDDFIEAVKAAQMKIGDVEKAAKEEQNAAKQNNQIGFGDKFKPKPGSWHCDVCYTNNLESFEKCACCETPNPQPKIETKEPPTVGSGWGDKFKPKPGSWECKQCLVRNGAELNQCNACNSPKDGTVKKTDNNFNDRPKFNFGIPSNVAQHTTGSNVTISKVPESSIFGSSLPQKFSFGIPKTENINFGATTKSFNTSNIFNPSTTASSIFSASTVSSSNIFTASTVSSTPSIFSAKTTNSASSVFNAGTVTSTSSLFSVSTVSSTPSILSTKTTSTAPSVFNVGTVTSTSSIFGANNANFTPSVFSASAVTSAPSTFNANTASSTPSIFSAGTGVSTSGILTTNAAKSKIANPIDYSVKNNNTESVTTTPIKAPLLQTPSTNITTFGKGNGTFDFSFKPKTPTKGKSPVKSPKGNRGEESEDNEYASEDEGHHIHFSPVVPMPEKIEVVTGEENEEELYSHRAKLYIFNKEWKERGIGNVKILKHKDTGKLRVLMRREQIHKICLNHALVPEITYKPKDDKTWLFCANDFSEGEVVLQKFCLRFKNKEIALQFKDAVDKALSGKKESVTSEGILQNKTADGEDVVFINEIKASNEEKQKAKELLLPEHFYTYKNKDPCPGCRGCDEDDNTRLESEKELPKSSVPLLQDSFATTPLKNPGLVFQSPIGSVYGTPNNFDRSSNNTTIFRTPLSSIKSNTTQASSLTTSTYSFNDSTDKENTLTESPNTHAVTQPVSFVSGGVLQNQGTVSKSSILAAPKLSAVNLSTDSIGSKCEIGTEVSGENKFGFGEIKPDSTISTSKPQFNFTAQSNKGDSQTSLFSDPTPVNFFSNNTQEGLFGPAALKNIQIRPSIFETRKFAFGTDQNQDRSKSIFGVATDDKNQNSVNTVPGKPVAPVEVASEKSEDTSSKPGETNKSVESVESDAAPKETLFKIDNSLTFENLSASGPGFGQKKPDFQWEGAGQQLFVSTPGKESRSKSKDDSGAADESGAAPDEEYDPHYEPIVPMPDKIVVTTGEEDEQKLFGERCKLFRFDEKSREWKERGVGEMKILYHPQRNSYRFLLRREQVHKAVLNMLLFMDISLLPLKNSNRAWTWAGQNFAEGEGEQETLAVRFKTPEIAAAFHDKVVECARKLQASAAEAIRQEKEAALKPKLEAISPLRLPKFLDESSRADGAQTSLTAGDATPLRLPKFLDESSRASLTAGDAASSVTPEEENGYADKPDGAGDAHHVYFEEPEEDHRDYDEDYEHDEDSEYENYEDDNEESMYYPCKAVVRQGEQLQTYELTHVQVPFDHDICSPKIVVTDADTGEVLADMLIHTDTEFHLSHDSCSWSGLDYTSNMPVEKEITITFIDEDTAMKFYDSCEYSKATTCTSTDPES